MFNEPPIDYSDTSTPKQEEADRSEHWKKIADMILTNDRQKLAYQKAYKDI